MSAAARPRVLVAGLYHETNTFLSERTGRADFDVREGDAMLAAIGDGSPLGYALERAQEYGWDVVPAIDLRATPSGMVKDAVAERFLAAVEGAVVGMGRLDGVLLILHGAMVTESFPDVEGEVMERLRAMPGLGGIPLVAVLDLHGNITDKMVRHGDAFAVYRENPHTDAGETGSRSARHLNGLMRSGKRLRTLCARPDVVWPPTGTATTADPMKALEALARNAEAADPSLVEVGVLAGFSFADMPEAGVGFTVSFRSGDPEAEKRARVILDRLCRLAWERRQEGNVVGVPLDEAIARARAHADADAPGGPLVMAEPADNIGGGAPGDRTRLLRALLESGISGAAATINDPDAVIALVDAAPGDMRRLTLGGKTGGAGGEALTVECVLLGCTDGGFTLEDRHSHLASMGGIHVEMGPTVLVRCRGADNGDVTVLLTSRKTPPFDLGQWRSQGVDPERFSVIAVKAAVAHRRAYDPIAGATLMVETPGPCASDLRTLPYRLLRRPVYPLDSEA